MRALPATIVAVCAFAVSHALIAGDAPIEYRLSFPEAEHHWMQVEVTFSALPPGPLEVRISRTSPGRYALHEFARHLTDVKVYDGHGKPLSFTQPNLHQWTVDGHDGTVRIAYRVFGNRLDGTYLSIDPSHAHINMPAALLWARGLGDRPTRVHLEPPAGTQWRAATQLFPTADPLTFEAPNFAYLMDSPIELSDLEMATFTVPVRADSQERATFRVALHHAGNRDEANRLAADLQKIAAAAREVFGEIPAFEPGFYTFLMDYLPGANGDGMEHRNSTVLTSQASLDVPLERRALLSTAAHELFHVWNVERIRPASLEPFNFEDTNVSGELWLGEGVTSYYDGLLLQRAGLRTLADTTADFVTLIEGVVLAPGRQFRSAVEMSRLAPFVDSASWVDVTNWQNTYISYYTFGAAIGLGLDLTLRDRSDGRITLDDYMRALWKVYGKPGGVAPGLVSKPYTLADARRLLAETSGDAAFAAEFFDRYIEGREVVDYASLLGRAGLLLRPRSPQRSWLGNAGFEFTEDGARLTTPTLVATPLYQAGLDHDDLLLTLDGARIRTQSQLDAVLARHRPGDRLAITFVRKEQTVTATIVLAADPRLELVPVEQTGKSLTPAAQTFRKAWLGGR